MNFKVRKTLITMLYFTFVGLTGYGEEELETRSYEALVREAETRHREGAYALALSHYEHIMELWRDGLPAHEETGENALEWVRFRIEDCRWRAALGRGSESRQVLESARENLLEMLDDIKTVERPQPPDRYAEILVSLGEWDILAAPEPNWDRGWKYFQEALNWWGGSTDLNEARIAYVSLVKRFVMAIIQKEESLNRRLSLVPLEVIENFLRLVEGEGDLAFGNFLFAQALTLRKYDPLQRLRISQAYQSAIRWALESRPLWLDEALYRFAKWLESEGRLYFDDSGNLVSEPNYGEAVRHYRILVEEFTPQTSPYVEKATRALSTIQAANLSVMVSHAFLPGSEVSFSLQSRNLESISVEIYRVDLNEDIDLSEGMEKDWIQRMKIRQIAPWKHYHFSPEPEQEYGFWSKAVRVDLIPDPGTYLVIAEAGEKRSADLLLVSSKSLVLKSSGNKLLAYFANAMTGEPVENAEVVVRMTPGPIGGEWEIQRGMTDSNGLVQFEFEGYNERQVILASAKEGEDQALAFTDNHFQRDESGARNVIVYSDRSLYNPGDTVNWKVISRVIEGEGSGYRIPEGEILKYGIFDPQGNVLDEGEVMLNAYGSAWGKFILSNEGEMVPGDYSIHFFAEGKELLPERTQLFRVEEMKIPELQVDITTKGQDQREESLFQLGDSVDVMIEVNYPSGGPVVDAEAEIIIHEEQYVRTNPLEPDREENKAKPPRVVSRQNYRTDGKGLVQFSLPAPTLRDRDLEYTIEVRIRDASGSEAVSRETILMTRQPYFVFLQPEYRLYRPGDTLEVSIAALDAKDNPVEVSGQLELMRLHWEEIWVDSRGRQISGDEYRNLQNKRGLFGFGSNTHNYRLLRSGYQIEELDVTELRTNERGEAAYSIKIEREGYYQLRWLSRDLSQVPIKSESGFFAADSASIDIGYHHGKLSIVMDPQRVRPGHPVPVMITSPVSDRWVLLTLGDVDMDQAMLLHMDGLVKLFNLTFSGKDVPGTYLEATMISGMQVFQTRKRVEIPPLENVIHVELKPDHEFYLPGDSAWWEIKTINGKENPVAAEFSLALSDEADYRVVPDPGQSPLEFFYRQERPFQIQTSSTFQWKPYLDNRPMEEEGAVPFPVSMREGTEVDPIQKSPEKNPDSRSNERDIASGEEALIWNENEPPGAFLEPNLTGEKGLQGEPYSNKDFESPLFWAPALKTDETGVARIEIPLPDTLATWRATVRAVTMDNQFGEGVGFVKTRLPLVTHLNVPGYLINGDSWEAGVVIQNNEMEDLEVDATLEIEGIEFIGNIAENEKKIIIEGRSLKRIPWKMKTTGPGEASLRFSARTENYGDTMEKKLMVREHGMPKVEGLSGYLDSRRMEVPIRLPDGIPPNSLEAELVLSSDLSGLLLEALGNLLEAKGWRTSEQAASKLLASMTLHRTLEEANLDVTRLYKRIPGNEGKSGNRELKSGWEAWLHEHTGQLARMQHENGGWSWIEQGPVDRAMTGYVTWALTLAEQQGYLSNDSMLMRAREYLFDALRSGEVELNEQVWLLHALALRLSGKEVKQPRAMEIDVFSNLWKNRNFLNASGTALLAVISDAYEFKEEREILERNLRRGAIGGEAEGRNNIVYWSPGSLPKKLEMSNVETTALAVRSLARSSIYQSVVDAAHHWLVRGRKEGDWRNSRETAVALAGLAEYLGNGAPSDMGNAALAVYWNGKLLEQGLFSDMQSGGGEIRIPLPANDFAGGENRLALERNKNTGRIYYRVTAHYYTAENPISSAGESIALERKYEHIKPQQTLLHGVKEKRISLESENYPINVGERIESILTMELDASYPYLIVEDFIPAGFEPTRTPNGESHYATRVDDGKNKGESVPVAMEYKDGKKVFLIDSMEKGKWEIRHALRAEIPGRFHALPAVIKANYIPQVQGNGSEVFLRVVNKNTP